MHRVFYTIGGLAVVGGLILVMIGLGSRDPVSGAASTQIGVAAIFGAIVWIGMGRALELLERIANRIAPLPKFEAAKPSDWQFDESGNVRPKPDNKRAVASETPKKPEPQSRTEPRF